MPNHVSEELLAVLDDAKINQDELAKRLHVSPGTINNWKKGATPQKASLRKILNLYRDYHANTLIQPLVEFKDTTSSGNIETPLKTG